MKGSKAERKGRLSLCALLIFALLLLFSFALAGENEDGKEGDFVYDPEPGELLEAVTVTMKDGEAYDIGTFKKATWLVCNDSGTFYVTGTSENTMLVINASAGKDMKIVFNNVRLVATKSCPGAAANARPAVDIRGSGGTVTLISAKDSENYFRAKGGSPTIRKDNKGVQLIFSTEDPIYPGKMEVHADPNAHCTTAIGCYGSTTKHHTFGNCVFESGQIEAYGSYGTVGGSVWYGGAAIGADEYSAVDGIVFEEYAKVTAVAGSASAAGIGTTSCYLFNIFTEVDRAPQPCSNIVINGGVILATHRAGSEDGSVYGGSGIGGGWGGSCDHLTINGGAIEALGSYGAAGIGGGQDGDAMNITINGGRIYAQGGAAGIGSGRASGYICADDSLRFGDCDLTINGGEITAIGGVSLDGGKTVGVGIGGWKEKFYKASDKVAGRMQLTVNGGNITAQGCGAPAIGSGEYGNFGQITISGGVIKVSTKDCAVDIGGYGPTSTCEKILITGGTLSHTENGKRVVIGGRNPQKHTETGDAHKTPVYISGGNVRGTVYGADYALLPDSEEKVYLYQFSLQDFSLSTVRSEDRTKVTALSVSPSLSYSYGLKDAYLFTSDKPSDAVADLWLPKAPDRTECALTVFPFFMEKGFHEQKEDVCEFAGPVSSSVSTLYPKLWFLFDENYTAGDLSRDAASFYIGRKSAETILNTSDEPLYYTTDPEGNVPLLKTDGSFYPSVTDSASGITWTDADGRLIPSPALAKSNYISGTPLYSVWPPFLLSYDLSGGQYRPGEENPAAYTVKDEIILVSPVRDGYVFIGWSGTDLPEPVICPVIPLGSRGERHFAANWAELPPTGDSARPMLWALCALCTGGVLMIYMVIKKRKA